MKKIFIIIQQELFSTFRRPSYLFFAFGLPLILVLVLAGIKIFEGRVEPQGEVNTNGPVEHQIDIEGFVDQSGLIKIIPDDLPQGHLIQFQTEDKALDALNSGEILAYYMIPEDYLESGNVSYIYPDTRSYLEDGQSWVIKWVLMVNTLDGDMALADLIWNPVWNLEMENISLEDTGAASAEGDCLRPGSSCGSNELVRYMPSIMVALFYVVFMMSSTMLFNSVGQEKESRTLEVLLVSIQPRQLLAGKIISAGIAGLGQVIMWLASVFVIITIGGTTLKLPDGFGFPISILVWGLIFFIGGFGLYASLMAGAGALIPRMKEAGAANFIAMIPLLFGYIVGLLAPLADAGNAAFPILLSFFPFTSPIVMIMRLTDGIVPLWHLLVSAGVLYASAYLALRAAAAMFHAHNLLSGQPFSVKRYIYVMVGNK